ncbi:hypothetical protein [Verrucomicrobium spinosum]|uniref:hypothetical protein n=1 Tax=Verrucomicrobium spinosum TaxID=2736 RepID=UPI0001745933|nr:hypothetical protein [Verrucomicrobium spinosum]
MKLLCTTRTPGALLTLSLLCAAVWGLGSCSREGAPPPATSEVSAPAPVKKKVSADGIEIIEHPALPETKDLRPLAVAPEPAANPAAAAAAMPAPAQPLTVSGEGGLTLSKAPGENGSLLTVESATDQKLQRQPQPAEGPQTAPMRLEARHQAMAEMLRVRKAAETANPVPAR